MDTQIHNDRLEKKAHIYPEILLVKHTVYE